MLRFSKFLHGETGRILMSIILGLGLATLFRKACKGRNCVVQKAPPLDEIDGKIYKFQNKCYKYNSVSVKCDKNKKFVEMDDEIK
jgi:hypothetical protein